MRLLGLVAVGVAVLALTVSSCGGGGGKSRGGTLTILSSGDVDDRLDPGYSYYQFDFIVTTATQRSLYTYKPDDTANPSPDLAASDPQISRDGKTVTVKIRKGVKFSPPVNREVTSADVKYALERDFLPSVGNGYATAYFGDVIGNKEFAAGKATDIKGIETPDRYTIVLRLKRSTGTVAAQALSLPGSAPVPKEYAKYDKSKVSSYGRHLVATGPYMVKNDPKSGKVTGYQPGKRIELVRNPNWDKSTDFRPAYMDRIVIDEGNDATIGSRKILSGQSMINNPADLPPPPEILKQFSSGGKKGQLVAGPYTGRFRFVALNTTVKPLDDINVRKAIVAGLDRKAMQLAFGGPFVGAIGTHFIPPGVRGFEEAGAFAGPGYDFMRSPSGNPQLAAEYLKKAGYKSGKYTGGEKLLMVADSAPAQKRVGEVALTGLQKLGFKVSFQAVARDTMYSKFCSVPKAKVAVCPSVGWLKDFADAQTMLDPTFKGSNIVPTNNSNWPELNDPKVNAAMTKAETIVGADARAKAWAAIDKTVTGLAPGALWLWDKPTSIRSKNVNDVIGKASANPEISYISLK